MKILVYDELDKNSIKDIEKDGENKVVTLNKNNFEKGDKELQDADILIGWGDTNDFTARRISMSKKLKWVHVLAAGVDKLPFKELKEKNIKVTNSSGIHATPISEHVFATLLFLEKKLDVLYKQQLNKCWRQQPIEELKDKTMAIIGVGQIGREIARKAKAFDMRVLGIKNTPTPVEYVDEMYSMDNLKEVLCKSHVVVIALPLTEETNGLFTLETFKSMRRDAYFINIGRGKIVHEESLIKSLQQGIIKGASLDVFQEEPLDKDSPLWHMDNVIITPHQSGNSPHYMERAVNIFMENLEKIKNGEELINLVDLNKKY
ncbi:putative 2-hydroxyacid dehydrogenase [Clostridium liquoris]|jgi:phosphoglycerate dehydrogenase-like enzyme|uniref:Putative 2-hydroxyacid dehydrogenase n=1 Tax=Clostridium liquoris TaxID=1289519 RepID=A0A2T0B159_9CLOT|nr:D-2-hydroxyacid dehydrogenase [Clostridium liquoris]PRR77263.1 putative 2-hydroxyacid dehydrogenase [Clostridium liquoris]